MEDRVFVAHLLGGRAGTQEELLGAGLHQGFRISDWSPDATRILYSFEDTLGREDIPAQHILNLVFTVPPFGSSPFLTAPAFVPLAGGSFFPDSRDRYIADTGPPHDDPLGSGEQITATLYAGAAGTLHTITATATNSAGTQRSASITVTAHQAGSPIHPAGSSTSIRTTSPSRSS